MRLRILVFTVSAASVLVLSGGTSVAASTQKLCMKASSQVLAPTPSGACKSGYKSVSLATQGEVASLQSEVAALKAKLSKVSYQPAGPNGKPTLRIAGANLQIVSGSGSTAGAVNGLGNLIIGYDEHPKTHLQTGSHNIVLGSGHEFTSYGGIIAGKNNVLSGPFSAVFGWGNSASGAYSSVSGGSGNSASGAYSSLSGGESNYATNYYSSVSGGYGNTASGYASSILGGVSQTVSTSYGTYP